MRCPYLTVDELCSIYDQRPDCCRNFPKTVTGFIAGRCDLDCKNCRDKCCNYIELDSLSDNPPKPIDFIRSLSVKCDDCRQCYSK